MKMIFAVNKLYRQYKSNDFYRFCARELSIETIKCQLPNKFDYRDGFYARRFGKLLVKTYFGIFKLIKYPFLLSKLVWGDYYMHEFSNQYGSTCFLYRGTKQPKKKIFSYIHGHAINISSKVNKKTYRAADSTLLSFHEHNRKTMDKKGFTTQHILGYPKFFPEWKNIVQRYSVKNHIVETKAVIFSRHVHPYYMDEEKYKELLLTSFKVLRSKLSNILVVIKPHPREEIDTIDEILKINNQDFYKFSREDASVLSQNAVLTISFWTSAILASLAFGIPSVEYYIEADKFRSVEPEGSVYKNLGIDSVSTENELSKFIDRVINKKYKIPKIIDQISADKNIDFFPN